MDLNTQKERFSLSYIEAIASQAGYQVVEPKVDHDSIDGAIMADFGQRPLIHFQAKSTSQNLVRNDAIHFPLSRKNYDDLRIEARNPRILVVLLMPEETSEWVRQDDNELCLRHCAYWRCLEGQPDRSNTTSITVEVPLANAFSSEQLTALMEKAERGDALC